MRSPSTIAVSIPTFRPKRLARRIREEGVLAKEFDWQSDEPQREGYVLSAAPGSRHVDVVLWLGYPKPPPPKPVKPLPPTYAKRGL